MISKNSLMRSSRRSALSRAMERYFSRSSGGNLALVMEKRQISDNGGKGRFEVVGQIHDEVIFPLLCVFSPRPEIFLRAWIRARFSSFSTSESSSGREMGGGLRFRQRFGGVDDGHPGIPSGFSQCAFRALKVMLPTSHNDKDDEHGREPSAGP